MLLPGLGLRRCRCRGLLLAARVAGGGLARGTLAAPTRMRVVLAARRRYWADRAEGAAGRVAQATGQGENELAAARVVAVLAEPDALPGAQGELALGYGDAQRGAQEAGLDVRRLKRCEMRN